MFQEIMRLFKRQSDVSNPGDIINVANGTYNQRVSITRSGSPGNYITFQSAVDKGATINGESDSPATLGSGSVPQFQGIFSVNASHIKISGFKIINSAYGGVVVNGFGNIPGILDVIIKDNYFNNIYSSAMYAALSGPGIVMDGNEVTNSHIAIAMTENEVVDMVAVNGFEIKNNYIHDNNHTESICVKPFRYVDGTTVKAGNGTIHHNRVKPIESAGIYLDGGNNIDIFNNIVYGGPGTSRGIALAVEGGTEVKNSRVYNNIVYNNGAYGIVIAFYAICDPMSFCESGPIDNIQIINNTVYNNDYAMGWGGGIVVAPPIAPNPAATNVIIRNNISWNNNISQISLQPGDIFDHNYTADPQFIVSGSDFHLQNTSPAINAGFAAGAPYNVDYDGVARPAGVGYDIGAYEFGGVLPVCAPNGCGGGCPTGCTGANDPDCIGQCLDNTCATDTDCEITPTPTPACNPNKDSVCNNNVCGGGTIQCDGSCSIFAPPVLYGTAVCGTNACGSGITNNCTGACDSPAPPLVPDNIGDVCYSAANICDQIGTGAVGCGGCNAVPLLPPSLEDYNFDGTPNTCTIDTCDKDGNVFHSNSCGGLVPCGRAGDNPATAEIDESKSCTICAMFYMLKSIINFIMELAIGVGVFVLILSGLLYSYSAGDQGKIQTAKSVLTSTLIGIAIIFAAWLIIAVVLQGMGYADMTTWNQVSLRGIGRIKK